MMFREVRYQTGEARQVAAEMRNGAIPCLEVYGHDDFEAFAARLSEYGIILSANIPYDKKARDGVKEPMFEFRAAFHPAPVAAASAATAATAKGLPDIMYIDVYFEPEPEKTYDPVGEM